MSKPGTLSDHDLLDGLERAIQEIKSSGTLSPDLLATVEDLIEEALHRGMPEFPLSVPYPSCQRRMLHLRVR